MAIELEKVTTDNQAHYEGLLSDLEGVINLAEDLLSRVEGFAEEGASSFNRASVLNDGYDVVRALRDALEVFQARTF